MLGELYGSEAQNISELWIWKPNPKNVVQTFSQVRISSISSPVWIHSEIIMRTFHSKKAKNWNTDKLDQPLRKTPTNALLQCRAGA